MTTASNVVILDVRVVPRSSRSEIVGMHNGMLKVKLTSPPVEGAANDELIRLLAKTFDVPRSQVEIVSGAAAKSKRIRLHGVSAAAVDASLKPKI